LFAPGSYVSTNGAHRQGDLFGRLLETFVVSQIRADVPMSESLPRLFHVRQQEGRLHTGPRTFSMADRIVAAPISALWS
jgi:hypothetical protein